MEKTAPVFRSVLVLCELCVTRLPLVIFSMSLPLFLLAHSRGYADETQNKKRLTIQGIVIDEQGQPVTGAIVFIESRDWFDFGLPNLETTTDAQGRFTLADELRHIQGQTLQAKDSQDRMAKITLPPSYKGSKQTNLNHLCLQLKPPRHVLLEVVDRQGKPVPDALTGIMARTKTWGIGKTDRAGKIEFQIPQDVHLKYAVALRDGYGTDYRAYILNPTKEFEPDAMPPKFPDHPVRLTLDGARPLKIKIESADGKPLSGIKLSPWTVNKPNQPAKLLLAGIFYAPRLLLQTTDEEGITIFAWIPHWQKGRMDLVIENKEYVPHRFFYDPAKDKRDLTIRLQPKPSKFE